VQELEAALEGAGLPAFMVDRGGDPGPDGRVRSLTMHRSKGLEFRVVFLCGVNEEVVPPGISGYRQGARGDDPMVADLAGEEEDRRKERISQERCLLYVAATRARDRLYVTSYGRPSPLWP
ncbi:MAG: 3'-5' exonuclease, partial [Kyrpidia sp.]|nr:3'-5' exonuclease [Kyrpidia sp.]